MDVNVLTNNELILNNRQVNSYVKIVFIII